VRRGDVLVVLDLDRLGRLSVLFSTPEALFLHIRL